MKLLLSRTNKYFIKVYFFFLNILLLLQALTLYLLHELSLKLLDPYLH